MLTAKVINEGNIQFVELPSECHFDGEEVRVVKSDDIVMLYMHKSLEKRAEAFDGDLCLDGEMDFGESVGRELW